MSTYSLARIYISVWGHQSKTWEVGQISWWPTRFQEQGHRGNLARQGARVQNSRPRVASHGDYRECRLRACMKNKGEWYMIPSLHHYHNYPYIVHDRLAHGYIYTG